MDESLNENSVRRLLEQKLADLRSEQEALRRPSAQVAAPVQYGKRAGDHIAESADRLARGRMALELERLEEEVQAALQKLDRGTYGLCERCGRAIPPGRLEALPWAVLCVDCKAGLRR